MKKKSMDTDGEQEGKKNVEKKNSWHDILVQWTNKSKFSFYRVKLPRVCMIL